MQHKIWNDMKYNFWDRTTSHILNINKVFSYLDKKCNFISNKEYQLDYNLTEKIDYNLLKDRIKTHDQSKFSNDEIIGYIYITEYYGKKCGYYFTKKEKQEMDKSWEHHYKTNPHHPDFHDDINNMSIIDIIEMVCDWGAMSLEFNNSLLEYVYNRAFTQWKWNKVKKDLILEFCNIIEEGLKNEEIC